MSEQIVEKAVSITSLQHGVSKELEHQILLAVSGIRYGSVEITVHDAKVVQIERKEKLRF